jgi:protein gp37
MNRTSIEWCRTYAADGTFEEGFSVNPVRFRPHGSTALRTMCQKVSPGCAHCYAEGINRRFGPKDAAVKFPGYTAAGLLAGEFVLDEAMLLQVLRTKKPARIFWGDMTDLFGEWVPDAFLDRMFAVCALTPHLTHIFLTKRAERMREYIARPDVAARIRRALIPYFHQAMTWTRGNPRGRRALRKVVASGTIPTPHVAWPLPNVWLGVSVENQEQADKRIPELLQTPASVRFASAEPLLGDIEFLFLNREPSDFDRAMPGFKQCAAFYTDALSGANSVVMKDCSYLYEEPAGTRVRLDWVIVGGESGAGARPMHPRWAQYIRGECAFAGVPFFFKQWGEFRDGSNFKADAIAVLTDGRDL